MTDPVQAIVDAIVNTITAQVDALHNPVAIDRDAVRQAIAGPMTTYFGIELFGEQLCHPEQVT